MADGLILESSFLIDLEREKQKEKAGPATRFLAEHVHRPLFITATIAGEMAAGIAEDRRREWEQLLSSFHVLPHTLDVSWTYSRIYRELRQMGRLIGTNDLWIAATAVTSRHALVTSNLDHFLRVPDLEVVPYR